MLAANNDTPQTVVQVNTLRISTQELVERLAQEEVTALPHSWMKDCLVLSNTGDLEHLKAFQEGLFYVQDAASKLAVQCAQIPQGEDIRVLDCCAAPGGKSFAAAVQGAGEITSCDIHGHKLELIEKSAQRLGFSNVTTCLQDGSVFNDQWENAMDAVIADVPCSGYGIIRKKPDIRYKDPKTMEQLPQLQLQILRNQARYVKPGGVLIYSTCTLVRAENEGVLEAFLQENPNYQLEPLPLSAVFPNNESGMLLLVPGEYDTDGFFISRLRRIK
jgi:16S rRNA (cytosine967-C5)-methyltransferase